MVLGAHENFIKEVHTAKMVLVAKDMLPNRPAEINERKLPHISKDRAEVGLKQTAKSSIKISSDNLNKFQNINAPECTRQYSFSRLCFKAGEIEPLEMDDTFCIIIKVGTFVMTKREFYETFPNVVKSKSYIQDRKYHYPTPHFGH